MNGDNTYEVTLKATDGTNTDTHDVTVMVTNVEEPGTVTLAPMSPVVGEEVTADLSDDDGDITGKSWQWSSADAMDGPFTDITGETSASYTPVDDDTGKYLQASVSYTDGEGSGKTAMAPTASTVTVTAANPLLVMYDREGDGIDRGDVIAAIRRYFADAADVPRTDVIAVIRLYFDSSN